MVKKVVEPKIPMLVKCYHAMSSSANVCNETKKDNVDNGKRKNYLEQQTYDGNVAKSSVHNNQGCNIQTSLEHQNKRMKSAPLQMNTGQSFGKQVKAMSMCRDDYLVLECNLLVAIIFNIGARSMNSWNQEIFLIFVVMK